MNAIAEPTYGNKLYDWHVRIVHGVQSFSLDYHGTQGECEWMAEQFNNALALHRKEEMSQTELERTGQDIRD